MTCELLLMCLFVCAVNGGGPEYVDNWPDGSVHFGQISGVSLDSHGNVFVFHRGARVWDASSFDSNNVFQQRYEGPIRDETIVVLDPFTGSVIKRFASDRFYLPHGITVDFEDNIWITDVALHQVFKFPRVNLSNKQEEWKSVLVLGSPFLPGTDSQFCKPTDVAVLKNGDFFVSDGYCNSRILKFDKNGKKLLEWGTDTIEGHPLQKYSLNVPHAVSIAEDKNLLFVADRENGRAVGFDVNTGEYKWEYKPPYQVGNRVFSVSYTPYRGGLLYMVFSNLYQSPSQGIVVDVNKKTIDATFNPPNSFKTAHDVVVSYNGHIAYVVELNPHRIWQFHTEMSNEPVKTESKAPNITQRLPDSVELAAISESDIPLSSSGTFGAYVLVTMIVLCTFAAVFYVLRSRSGRYKRYETQGLMQHQEEDIRLS